MILLKYKKLEREGYITGLIEVTVQVGFLMEIYSSREPFGFEMDVLCSKRIPTNVNKLAVIVSQFIMTPSFVSLIMFSLVVPYFFMFDP